MRTYHLPIFYCVNSVTLLVGRLCHSLEGNLLLEVPVVRLHTPCNVNYISRHYIRLQLGIIMVNFPIHSFLITSDSFSN